MATQSDDVHVPGWAAFLLGANGTGAETTGGEMETGSGPAIVCPAKDVVASPRRILWKISSAWRRRRGSQAGKTTERVEEHCAEPAPDLQVRGAFGCSGL